MQNAIATFCKNGLQLFAKRACKKHVPAAIRELDKIEMSRQLDGIYRMDHAVTATQKTILKAFGLSEDNVKYRVEEISKRLEKENKSGGTRT